MMDLIVAVVQKLSELTGLDTDELPILYDYVDPEALQSVIDSFEDPESNVQFTYGSYSVTVYGDETLEFEPILTNETKVVADD